MKMGGNNSSKDITMQTKSCWESASYFERNRWKWLLRFYIALSQLWLRTCIIKWVSCHKIFISPHHPTWQFPKWKMLKDFFFLKLLCYMNNFTKARPPLWPWISCFSYNVTILILVGSWANILDWNLWEYWCPCKVLLKSEVSPHHPPSKMLSSTHGFQVRGRRGKNLERCLKTSKLLWNSKFALATWLLQFSLKSLCVKLPDVGLSRLAHQNCNIAQK